MSSSHAKREGQVMLISIFALGGILIGATTIAGLLMTFQIRQATDLANSNKAFAAADSATECARYQYIRNVPTCPAFPSGPFPTNKAIASFTCYNSSDLIVACSDVDVYRIQAKGSSAKTERSIEAVYK